MPSAPALPSVQSPAPSLEDLSFHATSTPQVPSASHQAQHWFRSPRHSSSTMVDCHPILPRINDGRGSFALVQGPRGIDDNMISDRDPDTVLGGVITAEPAGDIAEQDSECSSILSHEGVYIAAAPVVFISSLRYKRREALYVSSPSRRLCRKHSRLSQGLR